jgi:hypothetical protein
LSHQQICNKLALTFSISPSRAERREDFPDPTLPTTAISSPGPDVIRLFYGHDFINVSSKLEFSSRAGLSSPVKFLWIRPRAFPQVVYYSGRLWPYSKNYTRLKRFDRDKHYRL